jgi:hypothetical protein
VAAPMERKLFDYFAKVKNNPDSTIKCLKIKKK